MDYGGTWKGTVNLVSSHSSLTLFLTSSDLHTALGITLGRVKSGPVNGQQCTIQSLPLVAVSRSSTSWTSRPIYAQSTNTQVPRKLSLALTLFVVTPMVLWCTIIKHEVCIIICFSQVSLLENPGGCYYFLGWLSMHGSTIKHFGFRVLASSMFNTITYCMSNSKTTDKTENRPVEST